MYSNIQAVSVHKGLVTFKSSLQPKGSPSHPQKIIHIFHILKISFLTYSLHFDNVIIILLNINFLHANTGHILCVALLGFVWCLKKFFSHYIYKNTHNLFSIFYILIMIIFKSSSPLEYIYTKKWGEKLSYFFFPNGYIVVLIYLLNNLLFP